MSRETDSATGALLSEERPRDLALGGGDFTAPPEVAVRALRRLRWSRWGALRVLLPAAVLAMVAGAIAGARSPWQGDARVPAVIGIAVALGLVVAAGMMGRVTLALAFGGALAFAALEGRAPGAAFEHGWRCTLIEWAVAAGPLAALWWYARREVLQFAPLTVAAVAAGGAFAGDAALHVLCGARELVGHVWLFHFGGLLLAAALAATVAALVSRRTSRV